MDQNRRLSGQFAPDQSGKIAPTSNPVVHRRIVLLESRNGSAHTEPIIKLSLKLDTSRPFPQANSLAKVASVVDSVSETADTDEGIAMAIGVVPRQGAYYANAAAYLGFLQEVGGSPRSWVLTSQGIFFLESNAKQRTKILEVLTAKMATAFEATDDQSHDLASTEDLSDSTASRRMAALNSWMETLLSSNVEETLSLERDEIRGRIPDAARLVAETRRKFRLSAEEKPLEICQKCFMAKSASGVCGCD